MIALDSNVLIDLLIGDSTYAESSEACIGEALAHDDVVVCEAVVAEVQAMLDTSANLMDMLSPLGIRYEPLSETAAMRAGHFQRAQNCNNAGAHRCSPSLESCSSKARAAAPSTPASLPSSA